jgi:hypothetical protein
MTLLFAGYVTPEYDDAIKEAFIDELIAMTENLETSLEDEMSPVATHLAPGEFLDDYETLPAMAAQPYYAFIDL